MLITQSINGVPIRLTDERWRHIKGRHPEMDGERDKLIETISMPDFVQKGDRGEKIALKFHMETPLSSKYLALYTGRFRI